MEEREQFLRTTCDGTEEVSYMRTFTPEELAKQRELLTDASIMLADIEQAKPYVEQKKKAIENLKAKAETVVEECFKYFDEETMMVGFYNAEGNLVSSRPAFHNEMQKTVFAEIRKTGTDN